MQEIRYDKCHVKRITCSRCFCLTQFSFNLTSRVTRKPGFNNNEQKYLVHMQGRLQVSGKGSAGEGLVRDCGLVFPGEYPGFQVIGDALKKFRRM